MDVILCNQKLITHYEFLVQPGDYEVFSLGCNLIIFCQIYCQVFCLENEWKMAFRLEREIRRIRHFYVKTVWSVAQPSS